MKLLFKWILVVVTVILLFLIVLGLLTPTPKESVDTKPLIQAQKKAAQDLPIEAVSQPKVASTAEERPTSTVALWELVKKDSHIDGNQIAAYTSFNSDEYASRIKVEITCSLAQKLLQITFSSEALDSEGNMTSASSYVDIVDFPGIGNIARGRAKFSGRTADLFLLPLPTNSNVGLLEDNRIINITDGEYTSGSEALSSLLPAYIELENFAGKIEITIPSDDASVNAVIGACK